MKATAILVLLLAGLGVGYIVYTQAQAHLEAEPENAPPPTRRPGPPPSRMSVDAPEDPANPETSPDAEASPADPEVAEALRHLAGNDNTHAFNATARLAALGDPAAVPALARTLRSHRDFYVRLGAATALGAFGQRADAGALIDALMDADTLVRTAAVEALAKITGRREEGYAPDADATSRSQGQAAWRRWLEANPLQGD